MIPLYIKCRKLIIDSSPTKPQTGKQWKEIIFAAAVVGNTKVGTSTMTINLI